MNSVFILWSYLVFAEKQDPFCRQDSISEIEILVKGQDLALSEHERDLFRSPGLPMSSRIIRLVGLVTLEDGVAQAFLGIRNDASSNEIIVRLKPNESYYGLFFLGFRENEDDPTFIDAEGHLVTLGFSSKSVKLFDSFRPLSSTILEAIYRGDEKFLMDDFQMRAQTGKSNFNLKSVDEYLPVRRSLALIASNQKRDFEAFSFFQLEGDFNDQMSDANYREVKQALGIGVWEPVSQRFYSSLEIVPVERCGEVPRRKVAVWDKDSKFALPGYQMEFDEIDSNEYYFNRCLTDDKREGVCCLKPEDTIHALMKGHQQKSEEDYRPKSPEFICRERVINQVSGEVLESCAELPRDECGRLNNNLPEARIEGRRCHLESGEGRCHQMTCIPSSEYQDENPCYDTKSLAAKKVGITERPEKMDARKREREATAIRDRLVGYGIVLGEILLEYPGIAKEEILQKLTDEDKLQIDGFFQDRIKSNIALMEWLRTKSIRAEDLRLDHRRLREVAKLALSEERDIGAEIDKIPPPEIEDQSHLPFHERFRMKKDGSPCGMNRVCKNGECIAYRAKDWLADWSRYQAMVKEEQKNLIEKLAASGAGLSSSPSEKCSVQNSAGETEIYKNGNTCILIPWTWTTNAVLGNCWEGQCLPCDHRSASKLLGLPPCPDIPGFPEMKGSRYSCTNPELCVYR